MDWYSSDHHFGHENSIFYCGRPYKDIDEMGMSFVKNHNALVKPDDTFYHLGDFSLGWSYVEQYTPFLNGRKILICGNHDHCHPANPKSKNPQKKQMMIQKYLDAGWSEVHLRLEVILPGLDEKVLLSHLPYLNSDLNRDDQRYERHRPVNRGQWLLCGHVHRLWRVYKNMINVGVDMHSYFPVSAEKIVEIIKNEKRSK